MGLLIPQEQWRIRSAWETYWEELADSDNESLHVAQNYLPTTPLLGYGFAREAFLDGLEEKRRILFLGNGISREPLDYYFSGFDVTVVDISETACEIFTQITKDVSRNVRDFIYNSLSNKTQSQRLENGSTTKSNQFVYCPGGSIEIVSADMFDWQPQSKWHYIHNKLAFLAFSEEEQEFLLSLYYSWLEASGKLQISYYSSRQNPFERIVEAAKKIGFIVKNENINDAFKESKPYRDNLEEYEKVWLKYDLEESKKDRLVAQGAKMLRIMWSSCL